MNPRRNGVSRIETDYLVIGAGAAGMAFTDSLIAHGDADVVMVDRRHRPGGHWNDAYGFVRLHQPSAYYGVNSTVLGDDRLDKAGPNAGFYERASGTEICGYFERVLDEQLLPSGRVSFFGKCEYTRSESGGHRLTSLLTGQEHEVVVRRKLVDATYLESVVPATRAPTYGVAPGVDLVAVNDLVRVERPHSRYVLVGGGKTSMDACSWLLANGVEAERIRWIRPRESWMLHRAWWQPLEQVASIVEGVALELEAAAQADSVDDLFRRLEACGRLVRIDQNVTPTMYRCATISEYELAQLRRIRDVIRLGRVVRIEGDRVVLEQGTVASGADDLYVDCSAAGLRVAPGRPIFEADRITLQQVRTCSPTFNAALIGYVEATRDDPANQNRLCPFNPYPDAAVDFIRGVITTLDAAKVWAGEPDVLGWMERSRLNFLKGAPDHAKEHRMQRALQRQSENVKPGLARLRQFQAELMGSAAPRDPLGTAPVPLAT